ncbi:MAG TPA: hypothetical protein VHB73_03285 [Alphaproteobacteria bacterium]|nr:hypothetical protein [Alphaproteobacteria bacterium]
MPQYISPGNESLYWNAHNQLTNEGVGLKGTQPGSPFHLHASTYFLQFDNGAAVRGELSGWKFHLTVQPADVPRATQIIGDIYQKYGLSTFKVATETAQRIFSQRDEGQAGKMFTLYDTGEGNQKWLSALQEIEARFNQENIHSCHPVQGDRALPGSRYAYYRYDGGRNYISAHETEMLPPEQRYNPHRLQDPFHAGLGPQAATAPTDSIYIRQSKILGRLEAAKIRNYGVRIENGQAHIIVPPDVSRTPVMEALGIKTDDFSRVGRFSAAGGMHTIVIPVQVLRTSLAEPMPTAPQAPVSDGTAQMQEKIAQRLRVADVKHSGIRIENTQLHITVPPNGSRGPIMDALGIKSDALPKIDRLAAAGGQHQVVIPLDVLPSSITGAESGFMSGLRAAAGRLGRGFNWTSTRVLLPAAAAYAGYEALMGDGAKAAQVLPGGPEVIALQNGASALHVAGSAVQNTAVSAATGAGISSAVAWGSGAAVSSAAATGAAVGGVIAAAGIGIGVLGVKGEQGLRQQMTNDYVHSFNMDLQAIASHGGKLPQGLAEAAQSMQMRLADHKHVTEDTVGFMNGTAQKLAESLDPAKNPQAKEMRARVMEALKFRSESELTNFIAELHSMGAGPTPNGPQTPAAGFTSRYAPAATTPSVVF